MRLPARAQSEAASARAGVTGTLRVDRRTSSLLRRLRPGDIAVLDHVDLDRRTAEALRDARVVAVVNATSFVSGRYPNLGPTVLSAAGVVLVEGVGAPALRDLREGATAWLHEGRLHVGREVVAEGRPMGPDDLVRVLEAAREGLAAQLGSLTHDTVELLRREHGPLLDGADLPVVRTAMAARPVVVVSRAFAWAQEMRGLRRFIRDHRPVLVGVDEGADAILEAGHRPDLVLVGEEALASVDTASGDARRRVSDRALKVSGEVLLHAHGPGRTAASERLERLGVRTGRLCLVGQTEDAALLLAHLSEASVIVTVGSHATLEELLDRSRTSLATTFLTRLRVGPRLVEARVVPALYAETVRTWQLVLVVLVGLLALAGSLAVTPLGELWWRDGLAWLEQVTG